MADALQYFGHEQGNAKNNLRLTKMLEKERHERVLHNYMEYNSNMYLEGYIEVKEWKNIWSTEIH